MTEFRGIKVVAVPELGQESCVGCIGRFVNCDDLMDMNCRGKIFQPASLHDGKRVHVVLTGGRKPSFPIKAVWFRDGGRSDIIHPEYYWTHSYKLGADIIAVERADNLKEEVK